MKQWEKLTYTNARGESIDFSRASRYHVNFKDVTGLSDVRSTIYSASSMGQDGDTLIGTRVEARDIDIVGHLNTTDPVERQAMRRRLNRVMNPHEGGTLTYEFAGTKRVIGCIPENSPVYSRKEKIFEKFSVGLSCLNPYWRDSGAIRTDIATWEPLMEFPEDGLEIVDVEWEIAARTESLIANIINAGDVNTGIEVAFSAYASVRNPEIIDIATGDYIRINTEMEPGDTIIVKTGYGVKSVRLIRGGVESNAFRLLDPGSTYLQLVPGDNLIRYNAADGLNSLDVSVKHDNLYLGV